MRTFDFSPLTGPVDKSAVATLRRQSIAEDVQPAATDDRFIFWMCVVFFIVSAGLVAFVDIGSLSPIAKVLYTAGGGALTAIFLVGILYGAYRLVVRWTQFFRAKQFASANGMTYAASESKPTWDSLLFNAKVVKSRGWNVFTATSEPVFEAGNYHYEYWLGKKLIGANWGYAVVDLGRPASRMVLRSTSRRSSRRFGPGAYLSNPILPLGGAADRKWRLYCPTGAEDEARHLFTPELLAALNKVGRYIDVEVKGQFLFVYSTRLLAFPRPRTVRSVFEVISLVSSLARTV